MPAHIPVVSRNAPSYIRDSRVPFRVSSCGLRMTESAVILSEAKDPVRRAAFCRSMLPYVRDSSALRPQNDRESAVILRSETTKDPVRRTAGFICLHTFPSVSRSTPSYIRDSRVPFRVSPCDLPTRRGRGYTYTGSYSSASPPQTRSLSALVGIVVARRPKGLPSTPFLLRKTVPFSRPRRQTQFSAPGGGRVFAPE